MTVVDVYEGELAEYWARACEGKRTHSARTARLAAAAMRADGLTVSAYRCPFPESHPDRRSETWHVGHPLTVDGLVRVARLLRARSGNAPGVPGRGTTRRRRPR